MKSKVLRVGLNNNNKKKKRKLKKFRLQQVHFVSALFEDFITGKDAIMPGKKKPESQGEFICRFYPSCIECLLELNRGFEEE